MILKKPNCFLKIQALVIILYHVFAAAATGITAFSLTNVTDHQALLAFKGQITSDPSNALSSWNDSIHFCAWTGVTCGKKHQRVTALRLPSLRLVGPLSPHVWNLTFLRVLDLEGNHLNGVLSQEIGRLSRLKGLHLTNNSFQGELPRNLSNCADLLALYLDGNNLTGRIPDELGSLLKLTQVELSSNGFTGLVPSSITNASRAVAIDFGVNALIGPIPADLGGLENLEWLSFEVNNLGTEEGDDFSFLTSLTNCTKLQVVSSSENRLKGTLPDSLANFSSNLTTLFLSSNFISGPTPSGIGNLVNLQRLALEENMLTGNIPSSIGKLSKLQIVELSENNLSGGIPSSLGNMTSLSDLHLGNNWLEGTIPASLRNCTQLNSLRLNDNLLVGVVPLELFGLSSISTLTLAGNHLTGPIPSLVGKLANLETLNVSENNMSGEIPPAMGDCLVLEYLYLGANQFSGTIPPSMSNLRGLKLLNLSRNNFSGQFPRFLADLPSIEAIDLSFNKFEGEVPNKGIFRNHSAVSVVGNNDICGGPPSLQLPICKGGATKRKTSSQRTVMVITVVVSIFFLLVGIIAIVLYRSKRLESRTAFTSPIEDHHPKLSYVELSRATNGFSPTNMIGEGSFGAVYKGVLPSNGQIVAVKVLKLKEHGASKSFMAECEALGNIRHRNLVKIITSCSGIDFQREDFKALIFEFMPNGSLEKWLHPVPNEMGGSDNNMRLSVIQRLGIAIDVATAVDYLHHQCHSGIIHSDLKPSNVLLDSDFSAHVSDFGLAKFLAVKASGTQSSSIGIRGTVGYVAPEYGVGGEVSTRGDIYSFGILLLELFTGKRPTEPMFSGEFGLRGFVERSLPDGLDQVLDPLLCLGRVQGDLKRSLLSVLKVGLMCSAAQPNERMDIGEAAAELEKAWDVLQVRRRRIRV
ncbi:hypothetical protein CDL15_Pgr026818 [Punica granatum]|uniref:non-specific serine/threonine protein kinase n=1 Tax=Punica granatum TaxID=22663 RepID=A0A218WLK6_PUNGR|nr:hypothetical protein CDL15_Pgr026818 [Punica granatum]